MTQSTSDSRLSPHEILVARVCFDEAIQTAADRLSGDFPPHRHLCCPKDTMELRLGAWGEGDEVDFAAIATRAVGMVLPGWQYESSDGAMFWFTKPLDSTASLLLGFKNTLPQMGKAYTLRVGIKRSVSPCEHSRWHASLFRLQGLAAEPSWVYSTTAEAEEVAREAAMFAAAVLPAFEQAIAHYFSPWPREFPSDIVRHENLTARAAFAVAEQNLQFLSSQSLLCEVTSEARELDVRAELGPELTTDGRLTENGLWLFRYVAPSDEYTFSIVVPAVGRMRKVDEYFYYERPFGNELSRPLRADWIDSDEMMALADSVGAGERVRRSRLLGIDCRLCTDARPLYRWACSEWYIDPGLQSHWRLQFLLHDEKSRRNDMRFAINATRGCGYVISREDDF